MKATGRGPSVCFFQTYRQDYVRTEALKLGLERRGVPLELCQVNGRSPLRYPRALWRFRRAQRVSDVVLANFRSFEVMELLRRMTAKPLIHDAHISIWQSACEERRWFKEDGVAGSMLRRLDRRNCRLADAVLLDTEAHRRYFADMLEVPLAKSLAVYASCDDRIFLAAPDSRAVPAEPTLFWFGSAIPLQGLDVLVAGFIEARRRGLAVKLRLAGSGPLLAAARRAIEAAGMLDQVETMPPLSPRATALQIARSDICLAGHFSTLAKASNVIPGKLALMLAGGKATIAGDSAATRELLRDGENSILVKMGSAAAVADAIQRLVRDPALMTRVALGGQNTYRQRLIPEIAIEPLLAALRALTPRTRT